MAQVTVNNVEEAIARQLKARAKRHGQTMEAEIHEILRAEVARNPEPVSDEAEPEIGLGTQLANRFEGIGFTQDEADALEIRGWTVREVNYDE